MGDPREHEDGNSDHEKASPATGDNLEQLGEDKEPLPDDDLPLNDGEEAIEEEDAG
jgi:hypothetical protein